MWFGGQVRGAGGRLTWELRAKEESMLESCNVRPSRTRHTSSHKHVSRPVHKSFPREIPAEIHRASCNNRWRSARHSCAATSWWPW